MVCPLLETKGAFGKRLHYPNYAIWNSKQISRGKKNFATILNNLERRISFLLRLQVCPIYSTISCFVAVLQKEEYKFPTVRPTDRHNLLEHPTKSSRVSWQFRPLQWAWSCIRDCVSKCREESSCGQILKERRKTRLEAWKWPTSPQP